MSLNAFIFVSFLSLFISTIYGQFICDSGDLYSICYITTTRVIDTPFVVQGNSLYITQSGSIQCNTLQCEIQFIFSSSFTVQGSISGGLINISAVEVSITGVISAINLGFGSGEGPGGGDESQGGSYGGWASYTSCTNKSANTITYGSAKQPTVFGSGGGGIGKGTANGGGIVAITSSTFMQIDGYIYANGGDGDNAGAGGGSGGSIWLIAASISGNGQVSAHGGDAAPMSEAGGGSGGRIAISGIPSTLKVEVPGGWAGDQCALGAFGTIYDSATDSLFITGYWQNTEISYSVIPPEDEFTNIYITTANVYISSTISSNNLYICDYSIINGCTDCPVFISANSNFSIDNTSSISTPSELFIYANTMNVEGLITAQFLGIKTAGDFYIGIYGVVSTSQKGYPAESGPGAGFSNLTYGGGGSYGGTSIIACSQTTLPVSLQPYGSFAFPQDLGSGGGNCGDEGGGTGGGLITIEVQTTVTLLGQVTADGGIGVGCAGGGSGGSISINATSIKGTGLISANGGNTSDPEGGLGSGGRISINAEIQPTISISAFGGFASACSLRGGAGTIYFTQNDTLWIYNGNSKTNQNGTIVNGLTPVPKDSVTYVLTNNANILASECEMNVTYFNLLTSSSLSAVNCPYDGTLFANYFVVDYTSFFLLQDWWTVESDKGDLYGSIFASAITLQVKTFNIFGGINTDGRGFGPGQGPGAGGSDPSGGPGGGAGHGADGVQSCGTAQGGQMYDTPTNPSVLGSGGGSSGMNVPGGAGGGLISIVGLNISLYGYLSANGLAGASIPTSAHSAGGGGSGGTISIIAHSSLSLSARAYVSAKGGDGGVATAEGGGGGGGGMVFVNASYINATNGVNVTANGGRTMCIGLIPNGTLLSQCPLGYSAPHIYPCQQCMPGTHSNDGITCQPCGLGTFANHPASISCTPCYEGMYTNVTGSIQCQSCPVQTFANKTGQIFCTPCSPGSVASGGASYCMNCGPGLYASVSYCAYCYAGSFSNQTANTQCTLCPRGYFQKDSGMTNCNACYTGTYCSNQGCSSCGDCPPGSYSNFTGASGCTQCPVYTYQPNPGYTLCWPCSTAYYPGQTSCNFYTTTWNATLTSTSGWSYSTISSNTGGGSSDNGDTSGLDIFFIFLGCFVGFFFICLCCCYYCKRRDRDGYTEIGTGNPLPILQTHNNPAQAQTISSLYPPPTPQQQANFPPVPPPRLSTSETSVQDEEDVRNQECVICCDAKRQTVLLPCGHISSCEACTRTLMANSPKCPICRNGIVSFVRMFNA